MVDKLKIGNLEFRPTLAYFCFRLEDCGQGNFLLEFDSLEDRELYQASMLELLGRLPGNKIDNMQIPQGRPESLENDGKFYLHLIAEHELGEETNGFLYRGVLIDPRILRITDIARFHRLMDQCRVATGEGLLPDITEVKEYVKNKRRDFLHSFREEGIRSAQQMADYHLLMQGQKTRQEFMESLKEFGALSESEQAQLTEKLSGDVEGSGTKDLEYMKVETAEPLSVQRTRSELEDVLNWRRGKLI